MFIVNDMVFLVILGKFRILDQILTDHIVIISAIKLQDYTLTIQTQLKKYPVYIVKTKWTFL